MKTSMSSIYGHLPQLSFLRRTHGKFLFQCCVGLTSAPIVMKDISYLEARIGENDYRKVWKIE